MSKGWYAVDVKETVFEEFRDRFFAYALPAADFDLLKTCSTRALMDGDCLEGIFPPSMIEACKKFVTERFFYYRSRKYGNEDFWSASARERDIAYHHGWHDYIKALISRYCPGKGNVLFVGAADGSEIPFDDRFVFYALEQLPDSARHIDCMKCREVICGDFEDETLVVGRRNGMDMICALRCMTPNTRIDRFFSFVDRNLKKDGVILLSHPMGYLSQDGTFGALPDAQDKLEAFRRRLSETLAENRNYILEKEAENSAESLFLLKRISV